MKRGILIILVLAAALRLHGLADQGFFMFDEARFVLEARELRAQVSFAGTHFSDLAAGRPVPAFHHRDFAEGTARPLHVAIMTLLGAEARAMLYFQAACGILLVIVTALLAGLPGLEVGLLLGTPANPTASPDRSRNAAIIFAALLAALSPSLVFWSRTLLAEIDAVLAFACCLLVLAGDRGPRREYAAGLLGGLALAVQSRMALILPVALLLDLLLRRSPARLARVAAGIALPVLVLQAGSLILENLFSQAGQADRVETYFEQLVNRARIDGGGFAGNRPLFALRYLGLVEGPTATVLALVLSAALLAFRKRVQAPGPIIVAGTFLWILVLATAYDQHRFSGERYGRMLAPAVPLALALAGRLIASAWVASRRGPIGKVLAVLLLLAVLVARPLDLEALLDLQAMHSDQAAMLSEATARTRTATAWSEEPLHVAVHLGPDSFPARFLPRSDTLTVVIMDERHARNFGFWRFLPDTPAFTLPRREHVVSPLVKLEIANHRDDFGLEAVTPSPAAVYLLGPDATVVP